MNNYVLDTNIISLILRNDIPVRRRFRQMLATNALILACPVVWYEVYRGLLTRDAKSQMTHFRNLFDGFVWQDYTQEDWSLASELWKQRRNQGLPIGDADLLIVVFARNRNATFVTDNEKDFTGLGVTIENWAVS
ncbi:MAG: PIN domain-containing protein [Anaerolineae bacterium]|nr:PIN domain-containing protein [Anaerolineae bacterium]